MTWFRPGRSLRALGLVLALLMPVAADVPAPSPTPAVAQSVGSPQPTASAWPKYRTVNGDLYQYYANGWSNVYAATYGRWVWIDVVPTPFPY